jgi:hypothetical protein
VDANHAGQSLVQTSGNGNKPTKPTDKPWALAVVDKADQKTFDKMETGHVRLNANDLGGGHLEPAKGIINDIIETADPEAIITHAPKQPFRLGYFSTACLIINRVIGTGIFNSPGTVIRGTNSVGAAMLLWFAGTLYGLAGIHVYVEYGLNVPRYVIDGIEQAVPRSGGDLHYVLSLTPF